MKIIQIGLAEGPDSIGGILDACPSAESSYIRVTTTLRAAFEAALSQGADGVCSPYTLSDNYFSDDDFRAGVDELVAAGKFVVLGSGGGPFGARIAHFVVPIGSNSPSGQDPSAWCQRLSSTSSYDINFVAGVLGQLMLDHPNENCFDAMARLAAGCSRGPGNWSQAANGWGDFDYVSSTGLSVVPLIGPVNVTAAKSADSKSVAFSWQNFRSTRWQRTRIADDSGRTIYEGTEASFLWKSDVTGDETFRFYSIDVGGNESTTEVFNVLNVTGLLGVPRQSGLIIEFDFDRNDPGEQMMVDNEALSKQIMDWNESDLK